MVYQTVFLTAKANRFKKGGIVIKPQVGRANHESGLQEKVKKVFYRDIAGIEIDLRE